MMKWGFFMVGGLLVAFCNCRMTPGLQTGLEGRIMKGPMCPGPVRLDRPCPSKPAVGAFLLVDAAGREVARFLTDAEGKFKIVAPPGTYFVVPALGKDKNYLEGRREVVVPAEGRGRVELVFDTGIR